MLFNSLEFLFVFFPLVTGLYFTLPYNYRWILLLLASCIFYMFFIPVYIFILLVTIVIDYLAAMYIEKSSGRKKKSLLIFSIISTCAVLFIFKYYNFFLSSFQDFGNLMGLHYPVEVLRIILPIGLSFHTFQSLSYVIEVYRGNQKAERHFGIYSLYVMFYPQLVAGPIERPQNLLHQFREKHDFDYGLFASGIRLMTWGLFKKIVIADRLAMLVNEVYDKPYNFSGTQFIIATVFFAFQIYCDFSGYSDIARGSARTMGFSLMKNFNAPYLSKSVSEFWTRWHISLSTWFKDYVYIPLGGNRVPRLKVYRNLLITFSLSGLWHGANFTYIAWGLLNGFYLVAGSMIRPFVSIGKKLKSIQVFVSTLITFLLICLAWVFFRARNITEALYIIKKMPQVLPEEFHPGMLKSEFVIAIVFIVLLLLTEIIAGKYDLVRASYSLPRYCRWAAYYSLVFIIIFFGVFAKTNFIYFQF